jgi:hypothetical protein
VRLNEAIDELHLEYLFTGSRMLHECCDGTAIEPAASMWSR